MDPLARKIIGILAVLAGIILGVIVLLTTSDSTSQELAGGVIAASVAAGVLLI